MMKLLLVIYMCVIQFYNVLSQDKMGGRGKWKVIKIEPCKEDDMYSIKVDVKQYKCGRTEECFDAKMNFDRDIVDTMGILINVCKIVDGGDCRQYQTLRDDSLLNFCKKYAEGNMISVLENAGMDPPDFPIKAGEMNVKKYVFNPCELPEESVWGEFIAHAYLLEDMVEIACMEVRLAFNSIDDDVTCEEAD